MGEEADLLDAAPVAVDTAAEGVTDLVGRDDRALAVVPRPPAGR